MDTKTATILSLAEVALHYANALGFAVFPVHGVTDGKCTCGDAHCKSPGKHPRIKNGCSDATTDADQIDVWWAQWPDANIGIATGQVSNLVVVDVDSDKGARHADLIIGPIDQTVFNTPKVKTGAGMHYYYAYPDGEDIRNSAGKLGKFIDIRGNGGYVVAPPSKHVSGKNYEFNNGSYDTPLDFPKEWIEKLKTKTPVNGNGTNGSVPVNGSGPGIFVPPPDPGLRVPGSVDFGSRNNTLISLAGLLRHHGFSENGIYSALNIENLRICKPPLDDKEVHDIAHSSGRYAPKHIIDPVSDDDSSQPDYENTLKPYLYRDFLKAIFEDKEILGFHIGKRDIAIIQAATNAGKTTLLRNIGLCMAAGRPFEPFFGGDRPIKIAYFDFENDAQDVQKDLRIMDDVFLPSEADKIKENLIVIPKGLMSGELFQFNTHEKWANELIRDNKVEFIVVDNISAAYDLNDENSNAEVTKKVIKPLLKMAYKCDCAFLFAHHYGKGKASEQEHAGVHAGRGASALQALSRTVINMFGDVSEGEPVTVECAKRKTDGGQKYREVFKLEPDRWFHHTKIVAPPKKQTAYQVVRHYMETVNFPFMRSMGELIVEFENDFSEVHIKRAVIELYKDGFLEKPKHGYYCNKAKPKP